MRNLSVNVAACSSLRASDGSFGVVVCKALGKNEFVGIIYIFFKYLVGEYLQEFSASFMFYTEPPKHNFLLDAFFDPDFSFLCKDFKTLHGLEAQHTKDSNMFICSLLWAPRVRYCANAGMLGVTRHFSVWRTVLWNPASGCGVVCVRTCFMMLRMGLTITAVSKWIVKPRMKNVRMLKAVRSYFDHVDTRAVVLCFRFATHEHISQKHI